MLRILLTCLAFLTGLIALGAPGHAMLAESSVSRSADEVCDPEEDNKRCVCRTKYAVRDWRIVAEKVCRLRGPVVFIPTVQYGPDRLRE